MNAYANTEGSGMFPSKDNEVTTTVFYSYLHRVIILDPSRFLHSTHSNTLRHSSVCCYHTLENFPSSPMRHQWATCKALLSKQQQKYSIEKEELTSVATGYEILV